MTKVLLLLGGNEGNPTENIMQAQQLIAKNIGSIIKESGYYESEPWGFVHDQNFINKIIEIECSHTPQKLLELSQNIEKTLGRKAKTKTEYEGRTMDIDILFYDHSIINEPHLTIPHPKLHERKFTLLPLAEKWRNLNHPVLLKTIQELLTECKDEGWVRFLI